MSTETPKLYGYTLLAIFLLFTVGITVTVAEPVNEAPAENAQLSPAVQQYFEHYMHGTSGFQRYQIYRVLHGMEPLEDKTKYRLVTAIAKENQ
jgi:hypothetical protein